MFPQWWKMYGVSPLHGGMEYSTMFFAYKSITPLIQWDAVPGACCDVENGMGPWLSPCPGCCPPWDSSSIPETSVLAEPPRLQCWEHSCGKCSSLCSTNSSLTSQMKFFEVSSHHENPWLQSALQYWGNALLGEWCSILACSPHSCNVEAWQAFFESFTGF